jgi:hypothetical protein
MYLELYARNNKLIKQESFYLQLLWGLNNFGQ